MTILVNCAKCGRFFESDGYVRLCSICIEQDINDFDRIREYLYQHPYAKMFEVSNTLDISIGKIKRYLREGRLEIVEKNNQFLKCEKCGKPICSGIYCDDCQKQVNQNIKVIYTGNAAKKSDQKFSYHAAEKK